MPAFPRPRLAAALAALAVASLVAPAGAATPAGPTAPAPAGAAKPDPLQTAATEPGAVVTASGLVYRSLKDGTGRSPRATDTVRVHYRGTFTDGRVFDSSYQRGQPAEFPLDRVIPCWTEGLQKMKAGGKARLTCPGRIAYGERGAPPTIPANATLVFEVELLAIIF